MKKSGKDRLKCAINESTLSTAARSPFPNGEGKEEGASPPPEEANPASLRSAAPFKGRGSCGYSLLPMEGGAPKGRRLGGKRDEKERGRSSQVRRLRKHPSAADAVPLPQWGRQRGGASPPQKEANPASLRSAAPSKGRGSRGHSLLPMEGGAPKGRRLDGESGMKKIGGDRLKYAIYESAAIPDTKPSPRGEGGERSEPDRGLAA